MHRPQRPVVSAKNPTAREQCMKERHEAEDYDGFKVAMTIFGVAVLINLFYMGMAFLVHVFYHTGDCPFLFW